MGDCKTDRAVCADASPKICTYGQPEPLTRDCNPGSYEFCDDPLEYSLCQVYDNLECRDGYYYPPGSYGSCDCIEERYDCWISWNPSGSPAPGASPPSVPTSSCTVNITPDAASVNVGSSFNLVASVVPVNGIVSRVDYSSTPNANLNPVSDSDPSGGWTSLVTGVSSGPATITANVYMGGVLRRSDTTSNFTVTNSGPWWQVKDSDVTVVNSNLVSPIPGSFVFDLDGDGGYPGVPMFSGRMMLRRG